MKILIMIRWHITLSGREKQTLDDDFVVLQVMQDICCRLVTLFRQGEMEEAKKLQHRMLEVNLAVTGKFGVPGWRAKKAFKACFR